MAFSNLVSSAGIIFGNGKEFLKFHPLILNHLILHHHWIYPASLSVVRLGGSNNIVKSFRNLDWARLNLTPDLLFAQVRITVDSEHRKFNENWLIVDDMAFMRLKNPLRYEGYFETDSKLECRSLTAELLDIWEGGKPARSEYSPFEPVAPCHKHILPTTVEHIADNQHRKSLVYCFVLLNGRSLDHRRLDLVNNVESAPIIKCSL